MKLNIWTSDLIINGCEGLTKEGKADNMALKKIQNDILSITSHIESSFPTKFNPNIEDSGERVNLLEGLVSNKFIDEFISYDSRYKDYTGLMKGLAIHLIAKYFESHGINSFCINFGGDIYCKNYNARIRISDKFYINKSGEFCVFTSNNIKRPGHIKRYEDNNVQSVTIVIDGFHPVLADMVATHLFSGKSMLYELTERYESDFNDIDIKVFQFASTTPDNPTEDSLVLINDSIYCASPFFSDKEVEIRDAMIVPLLANNEVFRPDLTKASKDYSGKPTKELATKIYDENISHIKSQRSLVFPKDTNDLGTLYEVGVAYKMDKVIITYDHATGIYEINLNKFPEFKLECNVVFDCMRKTHVIALGYNYDEKNTKLFYFLGNQLDNIMLSIPFTRVIKDDNGKYHATESNMEDVR